MTDPRNALQRMFEPANRWSNFGSAIVRIRVKQVRCHADTIVDIQSPITAFCGMNGTGKSTLLQLAAASYRLPEGESGKRYYVSDFIIVGTLDPNPFAPNARIEFDYWQENRSPKRLALSRREQSGRWRYPRSQPERHVCFAGVGLYLPRIEKRDFVVRKAKHIEVRSQSAVVDRVQDHTCRVLSCSYDEMLVKEVDAKGQSGYILAVERQGASYSEAHMGFGEGRAQFLIEKLESIPPKSLVLIEEPETSLHPGAQHEFARYLVNVAITRGHQVFLTTHSEFVLQALPAKARVYLLRDSEGLITPIPGLTAQQARSLMTDGRSKDLSILVEGEVGGAVLTELIRRSDPAFLKTVYITAVGSKDVIPKAVEALKDTPLHIAAVRDADAGDVPEEDKFVFSLPGDRPPEKELFDCTHFRTHVRDTYRIVLDDFEAELEGVGHHCWFRRLAERAQVSKAVLVGEAARCYATAVPEIDRNALVEQLKEAANR